jgi:hypothetical protein
MLRAFFWPTCVSFFRPAPTGVRNNGEKRARPGSYGGGELRAHAPFSASYRTPRRERFARTRGGTQNGADMKMAKRTRLKAILNAPSDLRGSYSTTKRADMKRSRLKGPLNDARNWNLKKCKIEPRYNSLGPMSRPSESASARPWCPLAGRKCEIEPTHNSVKPKGRTRRVSERPSSGSGTSSPPGASPASQKDVKTNPIESPTWTRRGGCECTRREESA